MAKTKNKSEEVTFKEFAQVLFWGDLKKETKIFLHENIKRYIPFLGISLLFFFCSLATLLPIYFFPNRLEVYLFSSLFTLLILIVLFAPSILALTDILIFDTMQEANHLPLTDAKTKFKNYFNGFYGWMGKIFARQTRILGIILKTILVYIFLFCLIIIPSHFIKISAEPQYLGILSQLSENFKLQNLYEKINSLFTLIPYFSIEILIVNLLTVVFFATYSMYSFYFILYKISATGVTYNISDSKKIFKYAVRKNKWSFAAYFVNSFKFYILTFIVLLAIFGCAFSFVFDDVLLIFIVTYSCSILGLFIAVPFFIKVMLNINISFIDIYLLGIFEFLKNKNKKNKENDENLIKEIEHVQKLISLLYNDRKLIYRKMKKAPIKEPETKEEFIKQEDALNKFFEKIDEEIEKISDD